VNAVTSFLSAGTQEEVSPRRLKSYGAQATPSGEYSPCAARHDHRGDYDSIFNINVKGVLFTVQRSLPLLSDGASIILTASIAASKGFSSDSVLSATKAAIRFFAPTSTADLKDRRIRVNAVSPGPTETPGFNELSPLAPAMMSTIYSCLRNNPSSPKYEIYSRVWVTMLFRKDRFQWPPHLAVFLPRWKLLGEERTAGEQCLLIH